MRERLNRPGRWFRHLLQLQKAFERFPGLRDALGEGRHPLGQIAALEIAKVATPDSLPHWIAMARTLSLAALRATIASHIEKEIEEKQNRNAHETKEAGDSEPASDATTLPMASNTGKPAAGAESLAQVDEIRVAQRLQLPPDVHLAEDLVIDLFQAVAGREEGVTAFAEALVGESMAAGWIPEPPEAPPRARLAHFPSSVAHEDIPRRSPMIQEAASLRPAAFCADTASRFDSPPMRRARHTLVTFDRLARQSTELARHFATHRQAAPPAQPPFVSPTNRVPAPTKQRVQRIRHLVRVFRFLARMEDLLEADMAALLLELHESRAWSLLGCTGLEHYAQRLGFGGSTARTHVALARSLRRLPRVRAAYRQGRIGREAAQWLVGALQSRRIDDAGSERWLEHVRTTTVRRLRDEARLLRRQRNREQIAVAQSLTRSGAPRGAVPAISARCSPPRPNEPPRHPSKPIEARHEVPSGSPPGSACPVKSTGTTVPFDDASWHASIERTPGRARQDLFGLGHGLAERLARGGPLLLRNRFFRLPHEVAATLRGCIRAVRRHLEEDGARPLTPAEESRQRPSARMAREFQRCRTRLPDWLCYLAMLEEAAWVWDEPRQGRRHPVLERDGFRCMAPGCTARAHLQVHHVKYRSWGGGNEAENLLSLCIFHHQHGEHGHLARCRGRAPLDLVWRLGLPDLGVWYHNDRLLA